MLCSVRTLLDSKWQRLSEFASNEPFQSGKAIFVLDFDGTIAPIVPIPAQAVPDPLMASVLMRIVERASLIVLSGRPVEFLRARLSYLRQSSFSDRIRLYGHYGLESIALDEEEVRVTPLNSNEMNDLAELRKRWLLNPVSEIYFEDKGYSCAFHYRNAISFKDELFDWIEQNVLSNGLVARAGKMVVEVMPCSAPTKVSVVRALSNSYDSIIFAGDDLGDLAVFEHIALESRSGLSRLSVLVKGGLETPGPLLSVSDLQVESPTELALVLNSILKKLPMV